MKKVALCLIMSVTLVGCAQLTHTTTNQSDSIEVTSCRQLYQQFDQYLLTRSHRDKNARQLAKFPHLRVNRFLASYSDDNLSDDQFNYWLKRLQVLGNEGYLIELQNASEKVDPRDHAFRQADLSRCSNLLVKTDALAIEQRQTILQQAKVDDDYQLWKRVLGLYPITLWPFKIGIATWHNKSKAEFAQHPETLNNFNTELQYQASIKSDPITSYQDIAKILIRSSKNPLHIPYPNRREAAQLFAHFAPVLIIKGRDKSDYVGKPSWQDEDFQDLVIDIQKPTAYRMISHTRFHHENLLQLNYTFWFESRKSRSAFDLLAGHIDGITYRITLAPSGKPLLYDVIHNCGCYYMAFPSPQLTLRQQNNIFQEAILVPKILDQAQIQNHMALTLSSGSHQVQQFFPAPTALQNSEYYTLHDYQELSTLKNSFGQSRSVFDTNGLIRGTERGERWFFWPMGIRSPGAMRQLGHHAIAFVGRRHFDDPYLIEENFEQSQ